MSDHALIQRARAAEATLEEWRARPWRMGEADCVRMTASHLRRLGYRIRLPAARSYRTAKTALAALARAGHASIPAALDALGLERITPAAALAGDIIQMPADPEGAAGADQLATLTIAMGNGRVMGWHPDAPAGAVIMQPLQMVAAWRAHPVGASA
ncbi:MAG TPA: hypothetical protein VN222_10600 [Novosphingobium sp.]|nr:hypothetical protein [Novosphingobium sp.]